MISFMGNGLQSMGHVKGGKELVSIGWVEENFGCDGIVLEEIDVSFEFMCWERCIRQ